MPDASPSQLLAYCRPGFEPECAQELQHWAATHDAGGFARAARDSAFVRFTMHGADGGAPRAWPSWRDTIFPRQLLREIGELSSLDVKDRLGPLVTLLRDAKIVAHDLWVETPDSAAGAELKALCRSFEAAALSTLRRQRIIRDDAPLRLHVCFLSGTHLVAAVSDPRDAAPWRMGIPRLKLSRDAPSRSALKIEEAWLTLLDDVERARWLQPGMTAVDLGAAPGGWTWELAKRSIRVTAVDNGPLRDNVLATGVVEHVRADGFRFVPKKNVDWVVCDMVEQPSRIAALMAEWLGRGYARAALFNLKLPMKKRWQETQDCLATLSDSLRPSQRGEPWHLRARQLYHDREEVTVVALPPMGRRARDRHTAELARDDPFDHDD